MICEIRGYYDFCLTYYGMLGLPLIYQPVNVSEQEAERELQA